MYTDEDLAFLRQARFGELPPRIVPSEQIELIEVDPRRDRPDPDPDPSGVMRLNG